VDPSFRRQCGPGARHPVSPCLLSRSPPSLTPHEKAALAPWGATGGGWFDRSRPGVGLGLAPAARFRRGRCFLGLHPRRDRPGLRPPLATRRLLLAVALRLRPDARLRRVG